METAQPTLILTAEQIRQKIRRIAFQIYENNVDESALLLAGITGEGFMVAQSLAGVLREIAPFAVDLIELVILIDDVLYTGRTLAFSLQPFLQVPVRKLQVAVLIDRNHPRYPVAADYKGYELSTTLTEHVDVVLSNDDRMGVYLR